MDQTNACIYLKTNRLDMPLETINARQLHSIVARIIGIPDDVTSVVLRVFKKDSKVFFDLPVSRGAVYPQAGTAYCIGTCFPDACTTKYEIHAYDARGNMTALGMGLLEVAAFTTSGEAITPGVSVPIMTITDATGALHTISAVMDSDGNYTSVLDA